MRALITGASSGIGREFAIILDNLGYDVIIVARRREKLEEVKNILKNETRIYTADLSVREECFRLFSAFPDIDILINNAGCGVFGGFSETDTEKELSMLDINISATHILMKLYLTEFKKKNKGYILNIASSAAFFSGPLFSSYYASKAYVYRLTKAVSYELKKNKSRVSVSVACPGPVNTGFNEKAGVNAGVGACSAESVAKYCIGKMFRKKPVITPGLPTKFTRFISKILPDCINQRFVYSLQKKKMKG